MVMKVTKSRGDIVPDSEYDAVVANVEERKNGEKRYYLIFFELHDGCHDGTVVSGIVPPRLWEGSELDKWLAAILGRRVAPGEEVDLASLLPGKKCRVRTENVSRSGGRKYSNVVDVSPWG